jgi:hypothetical protein
MITKTVEEVRTGWGPLVEAVLASDSPEGAGDHEVVAITRTRGRPADRVQAGEIVGVLVPFGWYTSIPADQRPAENDVRLMKSSDVRNGLREVLLATARGVHTAISLYGKSGAVLVPDDWYQQHAS